MGKKSFTKLKSVIIMFFLLLTFWLIIDSKITVESVLIGSIAALVIIFLNKELIFTDQDMEPLTFKSIWYFIVLVAALIIEIIKSNIHVAKVVLHPKMPIDPVFVKVRVKPKKALTKFINGNVINITPGTIVIEVKEDYYLVHALNKHNKDMLYDGRLERYVLRLEVKD